MLAFPPYTSFYFQDLPQTPNTLIPFVAAPSPKPNGTRKFTPHWGAARPQPSSRAYMVRKRFSDLKGGWGHKDHHHPRKYGLTWQSLRQGKSCCICSPFFGGNDMVFPFDGVYVSILLGDYWGAMMVNNTLTRLYLLGGLTFGRRPLDSHYKHDRFFLSNHHFGYDFCKKRYAIASIWRVWSQECSLIRMMGTKDMPGFVAPSKTHIASKKKTILSLLE